MANLSKITARACVAAFNVAGGNVETVIWRKLKPGAYDVTTGTLSIPQVEAEVKILVETLSASAQNAAGVSDKGFRVIALQPTAAPIEPAENDHVIRGGKTYTVKRVDIPAPNVFLALVDL